MVNRATLARLATVEWLGAGFGLFGSMLVALRTGASGYGFLLFLASNGCWLWFSWKRRSWGLFTMQVGFSMTSLLGIYRWLT